MNTEIDVNFEPLPGYRLIERLGAGGYGEVWRAEAPGGLTKAIKFVFGKQHEKRASNELRALEHVRGVRHPFLLSLERIEIVEGRLLVVTELADKSIKDRFDMCRREGLRGIPRDELLGYLRDAADALDFMSDTHALQHLDIKPENLLLLADHVKVADFGLVKNVRQSQASLVGGMTPLYAAPEVFRGTPSRHSDQYALAIVYQEMLTGTLPFAGSNAAELTLQHLNDEPDLAALAIADRYAISRALSKDPPHRYASCRELIEALCKVEANSTPSASSFGSAEFDDSPRHREDTPQLAAKTEFFDDGEAADWQPREQLLAELPLTDCRVIDQPPIDLGGRDVRPIPTLVIGIGGTAARVLSQLRRMVYDQFAGERLPALQLLLLDTDVRPSATPADGDFTGLTPDETLNLPLRRPQHYRDNSQQLLHWLSRRWLYNIPRSLRTEGLRPLGRLALADHARQAGQRIRRAMLQAIDPASISASNAATGQEFRNGALRVIVLASISGGTGGGMSLDIGYAVRAILPNIGVPETHVVGIMLHSTDRDARRSELARVNAFSWLSEFNHFQQLENCYLGDNSCGLPAHPAGVTAFDHTYLLHLGESLDAAELDQAAQSVAEYVRLNALSDAGAFFDTCRGVSVGEDQAPHPSPIPNLRSFGLCRRVAASREFCDAFAGLISQYVLSSWAGADCHAQPMAANEKTPVAVPDLAAADPANAHRSAELQLVHRLQLDTAALVANARALVEFQLGSSPASFLSGGLETSGTAQDPSAQLAAVDQMFLGRFDGAVDGEISVLGKPVPAIIKPLAEKLRSEVRRWITQRIDDPRHRLASARRGVRWINQHLLDIAAQLQQRQLVAAARLSQLRGDVAAMAADNLSLNQARTNQSVSPQAIEYFAVCLDRATILAAQHAVSLLLSDAKALSDEVTALGREIDQIAAAVGRAVSPHAANAGEAEFVSPSSSEARLAAELRAKLPDVAAQVDARLQTEYIDSIGGLAKTIMQGGRPRRSSLRNSTNSRAKSFIAPSPV